MKRKLIKIGTAIMLVLAMVMPVYAAITTEPTITTGTNLNNSRARTRSEFIEWRASSGVPDLINFRGRIYTAAEFFDAHHGSVFRYGVVNRRNSRNVRAVNVTRRTGTSPPRVVHNVQVTVPDVETEVETVAILTPPDDIGFNFRELVAAGFERGDIQTMFEREVIRIVNEIRAEYDLPPLVLHPELANIARLRTEEKVAYRVSGHISPTTGLEHTAHARAMGLNLRYAGENSLRGTRTPQAAVNAWMNSSGHRQFILSGHSTSRFRSLGYIGVGFSFCENYRTAWTLWQTCGEPPR